MLAGPPPTEDEVRQVFEEVLAGFAAGAEPVVVACYGFDDLPILEALEALRRAAPNPRTELLQAARDLYDAPRTWERA